MPADPLTSNKTGSSGGGGCSGRGRPRCSAARPVAAARGGRHAAAGGRPARALAGRHAAAPAAAAGGCHRSPVVSSGPGRVDWHPKAAGTLSVSEASSARPLHLRVRRRHGGTQQTNLCLHQTPLLSTLQGMSTRRYALEAPLPGLDSAPAPDAAAAAGQAAAVSRALASGFARAHVAEMVAA